jgi:CSLREA domain-containing protein
VTTLLFFCVKCLLYLINLLHIIGKKGINRLHSMSAGLIRGNPMTRPYSFFKRLLLLGFCGLLFSLSFASTFAQSSDNPRNHIRTDFFVNTFEDTLDFVPNNGECKDENGNCSLRAAISEANFTVAADTIHLQAGEYIITRSIASGEDDNQFDDFDIKNSVTIIGAGRDLTLVRGDTIDYIFHIPIPTATVNVVMQEFTLRGYLQKKNTNLRIDAPNTTITLNDMAFIENYRGISNTAGIVYLNNSIVAFNTNPGTGGIPNANWGGGIRNSGMMYITDSEISDNKSLGGTNGGTDFYGLGGGIWNDGVMTITGTNVLRNESSRSGGGIYNKLRSGGAANATNLNITNSNIRDNVAGTSVTANVYGYGGGIYNETNDFVSISRSEITDNRADAGGGIRNEKGGTITIGNSLIASNVAGHPTDSDFNPTFGGGGIDNNGAGSKVTITRTTITTNTAGAGAGILNYNGGEVVASETTISANAATASGASLENTEAMGGGVFNGGPAAGNSKMELTNVTISGNNATSSPRLGEGGGIWNKSALILKNVTIAYNTSGTGGGFFQDNLGVIGSVKVFNTLIDANDAIEIADDCRDEILAVDSEGNNLIGDADNCPAFSAGLNDQLNVDAGILALADNGAIYNPVTFTHALQSGSPAIDKGGALTCPSLDQRGYTRANTCDVGAYEVNGQVPTATSTGTVTATFTPTNTASITKTPPPTFTPTQTRTETLTRTPTSTLDPNITPSATNTPDPNATPTETETVDPNVTPTETSTPGGPTETPTATNTPGGPTSTPTATIEGVTEIVVNGGFEDGNKVPDNWKGTRLSSDKGVCNKDKDGDGTADKIVAHTGECAFQFKGVVGENSKLTQAVSADTFDDFVAGDLFTFSLWVEKKGLKDGAKAQAKFKYVNGNLGENGDGKDKIKLIIEKGDGDYAVVSAPALTLKGIVKDVKVSVGYKGANGKMYIDDVSLLRQEGATVATSTPSATPTSTPEVTGTPATSSEIVVNGDFELNNNGDKEPDNWKGSQLTDDKHVCNKTGETVAHGGMCAFQFKGVTGENSKLTQSVDADVFDDFQNGDLFDLSLWVEKNGLKKGAKVQVTFTYVNGNLGDNGDGKDKIKLEIEQGDGAYALLSAEQFRLKGIVKAVKIAVSYTGSGGRMYVDDISLARTPSTTLSEGDLLPLP